MAKKIEVKEVVEVKPEVSPEVAPENECVVPRDETPVENESPPPAPPTAAVIEKAPAAGDPPAKDPEETPVAPKERERMEGPKCYNCKSTNTFVTKTPPRTHPAFMRVRYYKCGNCGENFKA